MRFPLRPKLDHADEVAEFEGNEHVYFFHEYVLAARAAGFRIEQPWLRGVPASGAPLSPLAPDAGPIAQLRRRLRNYRGGRALIAGARLGRYAWRHVIRGDRSLYLDCHKPGRT